MRTYATLIGLLALPLLALAGPLDPPAGPIAPTPGPEPRTAISSTNTPGDADSLYKITQPGSYYLTGNITGVVGKHGIEIAASGVTLDLNGFDMSGVAAMGAFDGITVSTIGLTNITILNGSVRSWGDEGVDLNSVAVSICRIEGVSARGNAGNGIISGSSSSVTDCTANSNGGNGISTGITSHLTNCSASNNTSNGINASISCTLTGCSASTNVGFGIVVGNGGTASNCSAYDNAGFGISVGLSSTAINCSAYSNAGGGFFVSTGSSLTNCSAYSNSGHGIVAAFASIIGCTARSNYLDGIQVSSSCIVRGNISALNGINTTTGANIHATGNDNRIEENNCLSADFGIKVDGAGNFIVRNSGTGSTVEWEMVANNVVGPILDRRSPSSAAVSGYSYAGSLGTTDPNANFSY
jgi:hypothetical protein